MCAAASSGIATLIMTRPSRPATWLIREPTCCAEPLEADELWPGYAARLGTTKAKLQQTSLAGFASPTLCPKARFMNLAAPLRWARWCLLWISPGRSNRPLGASAVGVGDDRPRATGGDAWAG